MKFSEKFEFGAKTENSILSPEKLERALLARISIKESYNLPKTAVNAILGYGIKKSYFEYCIYSIFMSDNISGHGSKSEKKATTICAQYL